MSFTRWRPALAYGVPGLALGVLLASAVGGRGPTAEAQSAVPATDGAGTFAFAAPSGGSSQNLYLIDSRNQSLLIYRVDPQSGRGQGSVKLEAARNYRYDMKLSDYNNQSPSVAEVEEMVRRTGSVKH